MVSHRRYICICIGVCLCIRYPFLQPPSNSRVGLTRVLTPLILTLTLPLSLTQIPTLTLTLTLSVPLTFTLILSQTLL